MKTRLSLLMVLALLAALFATPVTRADGPVTGGVMGAGGRQTGAVLSILPVSWPGQPAGNVAAATKGPPTAYSHAGQDLSESWLITWDASTEGGGTDEGATVTRESHVTASIVVNYYTDGTSEYYANDYTATYLVDVVDTGACPEGGGYRKHWRHEITDPTRYNGIGPVTPNTVMPYKPTPWVGTRWTINALNLALGGIGGYNLYDAILCGGDREHWYETYEGLAYVEHLTSYVRTMFNSDDGPLFLYDVDAVFDVTDGRVTYPLHLREHLRVELLAGLDLSVRELEVTQGLQLQNTIPLVQGRRTIVRAYIGIGVNPGPIENVTGRLRGYDQGALIGELEPFNMAGSISAKRTPDWHNLNDTLNFELPYDWTLLPEIRLDFEVNPGREIGEQDYTNNLHSLTLPLRDCRPVRIAYLPIRFAPPALWPASPDADIARGHEFLRKVYPIADHELFYEPVPGMTWDRHIAGATLTDTVNNGEELTGELVSRLMSGSGGARADRLIGWLPADSVFGLLGLADNIPGHAAWVQEVKVPNLWQTTFAHEVGHTYGLWHGSGTTGGYRWIDVYERSIKPPNQDGTLTDLIYPYMDPALSYWVSPQSYTSLFDRFCRSSPSATRAGEPQAEELLVLSGSVSLTELQSGELYPLYRLAGTSLLPPAGSQPQYHLVLKNGTTELAVYAFDRYLEIDSTLPFTPTIAPFAFAVPYPDGVNRVELTDRDNNVLQTRVASASPPTVTVGFPSAGGLTLDGLQTLQWTGGDADGDSLSYSVLYSADNGVSWFGIGSDISGTSYEADFDTMPGSSSALIKVLVTDGFLTASDVSDQPFSVPSKPPVPAIIAPPAGAVFKTGEKVKLQGYAVDLEEGTLGSDSLSWSSDRDDALGSGSTLEVTLSEGTHTITLDVSGGAAGATTTVVVQVPPAPPEKSHLYVPLLLR